MSLGLAVVMLTNQILKLTLPCISFKTSRPVLANQEIVDHMVQDIEKLDNGNINGRQTKTEKDCEDGFDNECK